MGHKPRLLFLLVAQAPSPASLLPVISSEAAFWPSRETLRYPFPSGSEELSSRAQRGNPIVTTDVPAEEN